MQLLKSELEKLCDKATQAAAEAEIDAEEEAAEAGPEDPVADATVIATDVAISKFACTVLKLELGKVAKYGGLTNFLTEKLKYIFLHKIGPPGSGGVCMPITKFINWAEKSAKKAWNQYNNKYGCQYTWGSWSDCTGPCGGGIGSKTRTIDIKKHAWPGAKPCPVLVKDIQTKSCKTDPCPIPMCKWTNWSDCTGPCGGTGKKQE